MAYQPRIVDNELDELLPGLAAISVEGPRGVGKTSTALQRVDHVIRLDDPDQRQVIEADPRLLEPGEGSILIDEWQRFPYSWDYVRRAVDNHAPAGRFLMTGSATPKKAPAHTGAGRIVSLRMRPLTLAERGVAQPTVSLQALLSGTVPEISGTTDMGVADYVAEIIGSGLPGIRSLPPRQQRTQLEGYLSYALTHEVVDASEFKRAPDGLRRWISAYAAATSSTSSYNILLDSATPGESEKPARSTSEAYRNALTQLWLLDPVPGWVPFTNALNQLTQSPKHHLADSALAASVLGLNADILLGRARGRFADLLGPLFKSLVTLSVRVYAQAHEAKVSHLRTRGGRKEIDLIVEGPGGTVAAYRGKAHQLGGCQRCEAFVVA